MKKVCLLVILVAMFSGVNAQKYLTRSGEISFFSSTPIEDIEAHNKTVTAIFDSQSGAIQFSVTIKSFHFEKALMEEHFNENYMESDEFPKATFKGTIENISEIDFSKKGIYTSKIKGSLTIHGVSKEITANATFEVKGDGILGKTKIMVNPDDYGIEIPGVVREKIAKELEVAMTLNFKEKK